MWLLELPHGMIPGFTVQGSKVEGCGSCKLLKAQPLKSLSLTSRAFCLLQQVTGPAPDFMWEGTKQGCECWESWFIVGHLWKLVTIPINNIVKEVKSSTRVNAYEAAMSQSNRTRRTWILVSSVTNVESSLPLFWPWSFYLQSKKLWRIVICKNRGFWQHLLGTFKKYKFQPRQSSLSVWAST